MDRYVVRFMLILLAICLCGGGPGATAAESPEAAPVGIKATPGGQPAQEYWTPERMEQAQPKDIGRPRVTPQGQGQLGPCAPSPSPQRLSPASPGLEPGGGQEPRPPTPTPQSGLKPQADCPASYYSWSEVSYNLYWPERVMGKLYFVFQGGNYVCSGSLVAPNLVLTAGHCVCEDNAWSSNVIFVPAYDGFRTGNTNPYGQWDYNELWSFKGWLEDGKRCYDVGFIVLAAQGSTSVGNWLGYLGFATGGDPEDRAWTQFGYPGNISSGKRLQRNYSAYGDDDFEWWCHNTTAVGSPFGKGSSGGPWVWWDGDSYANGLNSYFYTDCVETMYGPYFGDSVWNLFQDLKNK